MAGRFARFIEELTRRKVIQTAGVYLFAAFVVMQVVDAVFQYIPFPDPDAAGTLVLVLLTLGFPVVLAISWAFDVTPPQFRRDVRPEGVGVAAQGQGAPRALRSDAVAVLPFDNLSDDPEGQYFTDGITEDIIASVARIQGLRVLARTSVMAFRGVNRRTGEIAAELGVRTVVTGSVRRSGSRVRIVAEAADGASEDLLWTATYDRDVEDIFEVQSDVASCIAVAVQRELTAADRRSIALRGTSDPEAYDRYLRARHLWNERTEAAVAQSLGYFDLAIERDPNFALAHSSLAEAYTVLGVYGARAPSEVFPQARASALKALSLDATMGEAVAANACVSAVFDWDWTAAEEGFRRALQLSPSYPTAHQWYAMNLLVPVGRFDDAQAELTRASELDPGSGSISVSRGIVAFYSRAYAAAAGELRNTRSLHPNFALVHYFLGQCQSFMGEVDAGLESLATSVRLSDASSETLSAHGHALAANGSTAEAEAVLKRLEDRAARRYVSPVLIAQVLIGLGRHGEAMGHLAGAVATRPTDLIWLGVRPHYDPLRELPEFTALLEQVNLVGLPTTRSSRETGP